MKRLLILTMITFFNCSPTRVETDFGGHGDFIIQNWSGKSIRVEITKVAQLGGEMDTSEIIQPDSSMTIFSDAIIGSNVTPQTSLTRMKIYNDSNGILILLYSQNPIEESKWTIEKQYSGDFGNTKNTFNFYDSLITN